MDWKIANGDAYPSILLELLGSHYQVANYGLSGRSLLSTSDYPYLKEKNAQQHWKAMRILLSS